VRLHPRAPVTSSRHRLLGFAHVPRQIREQSGRSLRPFEPWLFACDDEPAIEWTGIRNLYEPRSPLSALRLQPEDLIWALFMNRHIFSGADASLPLSSMLRAAEDAGFEVVDVERLSAHYVLT
jgi:hypothetical protein